MWIKTHDGWILNGDHLKSIETRVGEGGAGQIIATGSDDGFWILYEGPAAERVCDGIWNALVICEHIAVDLARSAERAQADLDAEEIAG